MTPSHLEKVLAIPIKPGDVLQCAKDRDGIRHIIHLWVIVLDNRKFAAITMVAWRSVAEASTLAGLINRLSPHFDEITVLSEEDVRPFLPNLNMLLATTEHGED